jgi:predicted glycosyltransferase
LKIWYDACTGKHVRYGAAIAKHFRRKGHEILFTTRAHPDTIPLAKLLGEDPVVVGEYAPSSLSSRLVESARRMATLARLLKSRMPDVAIAHQSVELCRVAFGLGIPIVLTADTPHAEAVNRLTVPLAKRLMISEAIPTKFYRRYGAQEIVRFRGVDEVGWIKDFKPLDRFQFKHPSIVVRQMETKASYAVGHRDESYALARKLAALGKVLFIPRYDKTPREGLIVREDFTDSASIVADADLVVSAGGTISREAALQGVPSIVASPIGKTYVNTYLARKGFPMFISTANKVVGLAKKLIGKKHDVRFKLVALENPVEIIEKVALQLVEPKAIKVKASVFKH